MRNKIQLNKAMVLCWNRWDSMLQIGGVLAPIKGECYGNIPISVGFVFLNSGIIYVYLFLFRGIDIYSYLVRESQNLWYHTIYVFGLLL